jgi:xylulokinase
VQIIADTIGSPISIVGTSEGAAHGAALIAAAGGGAFASVQEAAVGAVAIDRVVEPSERGDPADERAQIYSSLYPLLESSFKDLAGN